MKIRASKKYIQGIDMLVNNAQRFASDSSCGDDDICRYKTSVPCAEIKSLIKNAGGRK